MRAGKDRFPEIQRVFLEHSVEMLAMQLESQESAHTQENDERSGERENKPPSQAPGHGPNPPLHRFPASRPEFWVRPAGSRR